MFESRCFNRTGKKHLTILKASSIAGATKCLCRRAGAKQVPPITGQHRDRRGVIGRFDRRKMLLAVKHREGT